MKRIISVLVLAIAFNFNVHAQEDSLTYAEFFGTYSFEPGQPVEEVEIGFEDSVLTITSTQGTATLSKLGVDSFAMSVYDGTVVFRRDPETKKITGITIFVMSYTLEGTKEEDEDE